MRTQVGRATRITPPLTPQELPAVASSNSGECYSACALAFLGGERRHVTSGSTYGVHQFALRDPGAVPDPATGLAMGQVISADVVRYIRDMGVDERLFSEMTAARPHEINVIAPARLAALRVTTPMVSTLWETIAREGAVYARGQVDDPRGRHTVLAGCMPGSAGGLVPFIGAIVAAGEPQPIEFFAPEIDVDGTEIALPSPSVAQREGRISILGSVTPQILARLRSGQEMTVRIVPPSRIFFLGVSADLQAGRDKILGVLAMCLPTR